MNPTLTRAASNNFTRILSLLKAVSASLARGYLFEAFPAEKDDAPETTERLQPVLGVCVVDVAITAVAIG